MRAHSYDVIVIGAGVSGLCCAERLVEQGYKVLVLEASSRAGGRVFPHSEPGLDTPIELGAEFIHGVPRSIFQRTDPLGLTFIDVYDKHDFHDGDRLRKLNGFWDKIQDVVKKARAYKGTDKSAEAFVNSIKIPKATRDLFTAYVQGFHAADMQLLSLKGLIEAEEKEEVDLNGRGLFRFTSGYGPLLKTLTERIERDFPSIRYNTKVQSIDWKPGHADIMASSLDDGVDTKFSSHVVVVTTSVGVLKSHALMIDPLPPVISQALAAFEMGQVQRFVFRFQSRFWEKVSKEPIGFLHAGPENYFPTWWTQMPLRSPLLVAWQGGPKAIEMSKWPEEKKIVAAFETLGLMTGHTVEYLKGQLRSWHTQDWSQDPLVRGAYSYVLMGGMTATKQLAKPIENTLLFAGEATATKALRGTVQGAMESGWRAALQINKFIEPQTPKAVSYKTGHSHVAP
jgi:monoamine oxidase